MGLSMLLSVIPFPRPVSHSASESILAILLILKVKSGLGPLGDTRGEFDLMVDDSLKDAEIGGVGERRRGDILRSSDPLVISEVDR